MGRLWQTLILVNWRSELAYLPIETVETVIRDRQAEYYQALRLADNLSDAAPFVGFMLQAILIALQETVSTTAPVESSDQVTDHVTDQVMALLRILDAPRPLSAAELMAQLGLKHKPTFRKNYLLPAIHKGWVEMTDPGRPRTPQLEYRLTPMGCAIKKNTQGGQSHGGGL